MMPQELSVRDATIRSITLQSSIGNSEKFKIPFAITHRIADQILQIVQCNRIAILLYLLAMNLNTDKLIEI